MFSNIPDAYRILDVFSDDYRNNPCDGENMNGKRILQTLQNPRVLSVGTLALGVLLNTAGYCADTTDAGSNADMDAISGNIQNMLFGPTVRKAALTLGLGAGLFQAFMSGSIRPLLIYGGLGLAVNYLPKIANWISSI